MDPVKVSWIAQRLLRLRSAVTSGPFGVLMLFVVTDVLFVLARSVALALVISSWCCAASARLCLVISSSACVGNLSA